MGNIRGQCLVTGVGGLLWHCFHCTVWAGIFKPAKESWCTLKKQDIKERAQHRMERKCSNVVLGRGQVAGKLDVLLTDPPVLRTCCLVGFRLPIRFLLESLSSKIVYCQVSASTSDLSCNGVILSCNCVTVEFCLFCC